MSLQFLLNVSKKFFGARKQNFLWSFYVSPHNLVSSFIFPSVTVSSLTPILLLRPCMHCIKVLRYRMIRRSLLIANVIYQTLTVTTLPFHHFLFYFSRLIFFVLPPFISYVISFYSSYAFYFVFLRLASFRCSFFLLFLAFPLLYSFSILPFVWRMQDRI